MTNKLPVVASKDFMEGYNAGWNDFGFKKDYRFKESTDNEPKGNKTPNPVDFEKGEVNEVERALEDLKKALPKPLEADLSEDKAKSWRDQYFLVCDAGWNFVNALEVSNPEPKTDMKEKRVDPEIEIGSEWQSIDGKVVTIDFVKNDFALVVWTYKNKDERLGEITLATCKEDFIKDFKEIIS